MRRRSDLKILSNPKIKILLILAVLGCRQTFNLTFSLDGMTWSDNIILKEDNIKMRVNGKYFPTSKSDDLDIKIMDESNTLIGDNFNLRNIEVDSRFKYQFVPRAIRNDNPDEITIHLKFNHSDYNTITKEELTKQVNSIYAILTIKNIFNEDKMIYIKLDDNIIRIFG